MSTQAYNFGGIDLELHVGSDVFEPNLTTRLLAETVDIPSGSRVLDLGCGIGPIAIIAVKKGAGEVVAVDVMETACRYAERNAALNEVADRVRIINGNLFEGLDGEKFDIIIDDVSGMAEGVSRISPWYPESIPTGGHDGTAPTIDMLQRARAYLKEGGQLYFPVLSLANHQRILEVAREVYGDKLESVASKWVPFCDEFKENMAEMERMKNEGVIDYISKRSRHLWRLEIYRAAI